MLWNVLLALRLRSCLRIALCLLVLFILSFPHIFGVSLIGLAARNVHCRAARKASDLASARST